MNEHPNGWNPNITDEEYFSAPGINFSDMSLALKGPLAYQNRKRYPLSDSPTLQFGSDFHRLALFGEYPKKMTATNKKLLETMYDQLKRVRFYREIINNKQPTLEVPGFASGRKIKPDIRVSSLGLIVDIKTTSDASPEAFKWSVKKFNYDMQAAHYLDTANLISPKERYTTFLFVAIEKSSPFNVFIHELSDRVLENAREKIVHAMELIHEYDQRLDELAQDEQNQINLVDFPY